MPLLLEGHPSGLWTHPQTPLVHLKAALVGACLVADVAPMVLFHSELRSRMVMLSAFFARASAATFKDCTQCVDDLATALRSAEDHVCTSNDTSALWELHTLRCALSAARMWSCTSCWRAGDSC